MIFAHVFAAALSAVCFGDSVAQGRPFFALAFAACALANVGAVWRDLSTEEPDETL